jgi:hypothetical protein
MSVQFVLTRLTARIHVAAAAPPRLRSPSFIMYYLTFPLPKLVALLDKHGFSVDVRHGVFAGRFGHVRLVIGSVGDSREIRAVFAKCGS